MAKKTDSIKNPSENKFQKYADIGLLQYLLPVIPPDAKLDPHSKLSQDHLGKIPGKMTDTVDGLWSGFSGWSKYETTDIDLANWRSWPCGIAMRAVIYQGIDIDVDNPELAKEIQEFIEDEFGKTAIRGRSDSPRKILIYKLKDGEVPPKKRRVVFEDGTGMVEFLGDGQHYVIEGQHPKGGQYTNNLADTRIQEISAADLERIEKYMLGYFGTENQKPTRTRKTRAGRVYSETGKRSVETMQRIIRRWMPDTGRWDALRDLVWGGVKDRGKKFGLLDAEAYMSLVPESKRDDTWDRYYNEIPALVDGANNKVEDEKTLPPVHIKKKQEAPGFPEELLFPDDEYGRYIKDVMETTPHRSNPVAAFVQGHSMIQHCSGPFVTEVGDTTSGMYVAVGPTKVGKTLTAKAARKYLPLQALKQKYSQLGSAEGLEDLISLVQSRPDLLFQIDEMGFLFKEMKVKKSSGSLWGELLELATIGAEIYTTRPLAEKEPVAIYAPHIVLTGSTTEAALCGGLTQEEIDTGGVNRMLLFNAANNVTIKRQLPKKPCADHMDRLSRLFELGVMDPIKRVNDPPVVGITPELLDHIFDIEEKNMNASNLRGRHIEIAKAWAMGRVLFNNPESPVLGVGDFDWGYAVADCTYKYTEYLFDTVLSASEISKIEDDLINKLSKLGGDVRRADALNIRSWKKLGSYRTTQTLGAMEKAKRIHCYELTKPSGRTELRIRLIDE